MEPAPLSHADDLALAAQASQGGMSAWHDFVMRYSGLIRAIVRRYHPSKPEDDQLTVFVDILEYLYLEGLGRYDGRAALSTWVMTVARSRCLDALRKDLGRRRPPKWLLMSPMMDQRVYQLFYMEFRTIPAIFQRLIHEGHHLTEQELEATIERLESRMDRSMRRRLAYDLKARSVGALSGRLLEIVDHLRMEQENAGDTGRPDQALFEKRTRRLLEEIGLCVRELDQTERQVITLRYYEEMSAPAIARQMNLAGSRRVYALIDRALAHLNTRIEMRFGRDGLSRLRAPLRQFFRRAL